VKKLLFIFFLTGACSTKSPEILKRGDLKDLVLKPRTGHADYLTNQTCAEYKKDTNECIKWDLVKFHLLDRPTRERLRNLKFICNVNGQRFRICENSRGLCQQYVTKGGLFKKKEVKLVKYLSGLTDYQFLIDAKTYCAAQDSKVGQAMFKDIPTDLE